MIRKLWDELECRHEGLTRRAIKVSVPFVHGLDTMMVKHELHQMIDEAGAEWPFYVREWHKKNITISTTSRPSAADVLCNVNKPSRFGGECVCDAGFSGVFCSESVDCTTGLYDVQGAPSCAALGGESEASLSTDAVPTQLVLSSS